jgi:uncharacterized protein (TIGR02145 family)
MKKITLIVLMLFTVLSYAQGEQLYADGTATDQDGNSFEWINYGTQDWAIENAEVVTYRDGTAIPQVIDQAQWANLTTGAWCYFDNDSSKEKLYNWYAVAGIHDNDETTPNKEFAPEGWVIPSNNEINQFNEFLNSNYNCAESSSTQTNWISKSIASKSNWDAVADGYANYLCTPGYNPNDNNISGFNLTPSGNRQLDGLFSGEGSYGLLISKTEWDNNSAYNRVVFYNGVYLDGWYANSKKRGSTVRFVRNASSVGANGDILLNGTVSAENNQIKNVADPTDAQDAVTLAYINQLESSNDDLQEQFDNLQVQIDNLQAQIDALQPSTSVTDQDGNTYEYLTYGAQVWTVENAEMVTYRDGTPIPQVTATTEWANLNTGAWCYYDNDPTKGKLYNWYAVMGIHDTDPNTPNKEFAPEGCHVPSNAEWTELENYLIANGYNYDGTTTGDKIAKAMASIDGWQNSDGDGTPGNSETNNNSSQFTALPVGERRDDSGSFVYQGVGACFWSSEVISTFEADRRCIYYHIADVRGGVMNKQNGYSIRFVKDN